MATLVYRSAVSATESEPQASPRSFLARCKAIVANVASPIKGVPLKLKHRVGEFRPKARSIYLRRSLRLLVPEWNERTVKRSETILGIILIVVAFLLFKPSDEMETASSAVPSATLVNEEKQEELDPGMQFLAYQGASPSFLQQLAPLNAPRPCTRFHSFSDPGNRFSFSPAQSWKTDYLMSTHAACNVAQHLEQSMPLFLSRGNHAFPKAPLAHYQAKRALRHPLITRMMSKSRKRAFETYMLSNRANASAVPMIGVMNRFRKLTSVLNEACGPGPVAEETSSEE